MSRADTNLSMLIEYSKSNTPVCASVCVCPSLPLSTQPESINSTGVPCHDKSLTLETTDTEMPCHDKRLNLETTDLPSLVLQTTVRVLSGTGS